MSEERRRSSRVRAYRPIRLRIPGSQRPIETLTKDVSVGGVRCLSSSWLPASLDVSLQLLLSNGQELMSIKGRTAWIRIIPHSDQFDLGIQFDEIAEPDKRRLSVYLEMLSPQEPSIQQAT